MNSTEPTIPPAFDLERFKQQLAETIAWCAPRAASSDIEHALRSSVSAPPDTLNCLESDEKWEATAFQLQRTQGYKSFFAARTQRLRDENTPVIPISQDMAGGKLLIFCSDWCLCEGAMSIASNGFFGDDDLPAWDTWVYYEPFNDHLICWIPSELVAKVEAGLKVMSLEWSWWLTSDDDDEYAIMLKNEGFSLHVAPPSKPRHAEPMLTPTEMQAAIMKRPSEPTPERNNLRLFIDRLRELFR